jgi:glycosyltransferase involved in cell wall biosynthesis
MDGEAHLTTGEAAPGNRRPVVLQVLPSLVTGGAERGCVDVALALAAAGGTPLVASEGGPMADELLAHGVRHLTMPLASKNPLVIARNARRLAAVIRAAGVDIVHARSRAPAWSAWLACRRTDARFMTTFHAPYGFSNGLKRLYNSVMARGERIVAISGFIHQHIIANYRVDPAVLRLIHRGIDGDVFDPDRVAPGRGAALARQWGVPDDGRPVIVLPARLTRWKGQTVMIDALARLGRRDVVCLLVGSDQGRTAYRQELERRIAGHGLDGVVILAGHCPDMAAAYGLADVVVSASREPEAFGRVIVEAQAMGRPVIVSDTGAVAETLRDGDTGWVVPPDDPEALARALAQALALTPEQRRAMGRRARAFVAGRFTRQGMCADTLAVYDELMAGRS